MGDRSVSQFLHRSRRGRDRASDSTAAPAHWEAARPAAACPVCCLSAMRPSGTRATPGEACARDCAHREAAASHLRTNK
eukprot:4688048-Prymnesium_polylepis.6